jgi:hypothetical protein
VDRTRSVPALSPRELQTPAPRRLHLFPFRECLRDRRLPAYGRQDGAGHQHHRRYYGPAATNGRRIRSRARLILPRLMARGLDVTGRVSGSIGLPVAKRLLILVLIAFGHLIRQALPRLGSVGRGYTPTKEFEDRQGRLPVGQLELQGLIEERPVALGCRIACSLSSFGVEEAPGPGQRARAAAPRSLQLTTVAEP